MEAARTGSLDALRVLLEFEADVNAHTNDGRQTALMWAVAQQHPEVVGLLLETGADAYARTRTRRNIVMLDRGPRRVAKTSSEVGTEVEMGGITFDVCRPGRRRRVGSALAEGRSGDQRSRGGWQLASGRSSHFCSRRNGSQWALSSAWAGATPLLLAASYLELDIMRTLVAGGATVTPALADGTTPLLVAAGITIERRLNRPLDHMDTSTDIGDDCCDRPEDGVVEAVGVLLEGGADVNEANLAGDTALHAAASNGYTTLIQLLADRGAKLDAKNQNGQTPLALTSGGEGRGRGSRARESRETTPKVGRHKLIALNPS